MNMHSYTCCSDAVQSAEIASLASTLKIISEPNRLRILCALQNGKEHCVCELTDHLKDISQSLLSHHIADLRHAGLIAGEKRGLRVYYRLTTAGTTVTKTVLLLTKQEARV